jgi:hypothetical protein
MSGAVIIRVAILFQFRRYSAIVISAAQNSTEGEVVLPLLRFVMSSKDLLNRFKKIAANQVLLCAGIQLVFPIEGTYIKRILENPH